MATGEHVTEWSTTAACTPAGSDSIGSTLDDELRQLKATIYSTSQLDYTAPAAAYTSTISDHASMILMQPTGSTLTVSLAPAATTGKGWRTAVGNFGTNDGVLVDGTGTEEVNGSITYSLTEARQVVEFVSNGVDGYAISQDYRPGPYEPEFASGTAFIFYQDAAPTGYTRVNAASGGAIIKLVDSGETAGVTGGSVGFETLFARTATDGHTLTSGQSGLPAHTHGFQRRAVDNNLTPGSSNTGDNGLESATTSANTAADAAEAHSHNIDMQVQFHVCIIATKD